MEYNQWCEELLDNWRKKEVDQIVNLFDENAIYYETPTTKINAKEIRKMWEEIKEQNTSKIKFQILCENEKCCIVNFILEDKVTYDMIYLIKLNEKNKCTFFKQWYMEV